MEHELYPWIRMAAATRRLLPAALVVVTAWPLPAAPQGSLRQAIRDHCRSHATEIVAELAGLVSLANEAGDRDAIEANVRQLQAMLERRGLTVAVLGGGEGPPALLAERAGPGATRTVVFYAHYDGQPVQPAAWADPPWRATLRSGRLEDGAGTEAIEGIDADGCGEWRLYGRSAADDKGPIVALLAALDALDAADVPLSVNLKLFLDGEEERGSPHLAGILARHSELLDADVWIFCDGPVHQTRRPQVVFGVRGVASVEMTTFGPAVALHSGHYGNWAPDPGMQLAHLLASMRDDDGSLTIAGLDQLRRPLSPLARAALESAPPVDAELRQQLELGWTEGAPATLAERITLPAMNLLGIAAGAVGDRAKNAVPTTATAVVGFRLVPDITPEALRHAVEAHLARLGYEVVAEPPDGDLRRARGRLVQLRWGDGYPALWTAMELPVSRAVVETVEEASEMPVVLTQSLGGSLPLHVFREHLRTPVIVLPMVNHDNNQHGANENLRLRNLWDGIEVYATLMARLGQRWSARTAR